jgi:type-F conjugative transfer system protein TrbI
MSEWTIALCAGVLGGLLAVAAERWIEPPPQLATVDLQQILAEHIESVGLRHLDSQAAAKDAAAYGAALQASLDELEREQHALLLPAPAVLRGAPDLTDALRQRIDARLRDEVKP